MESPSVRVGGNRWQTEAMPARFLQVSDVAEELSVSMSQVYHMVRSGELPAIKVGGRGQWRVGRGRGWGDLAPKDHQAAGRGDGKPPPPAGGGARGRGVPAPHPPRGPG